jgi:hypothetical protein
LTDKLNGDFHRLNRISFISDAGVGIVDFVEKSYFPAIEKKLAKKHGQGLQASYESS